MSCDNEENAPVVHDEWVPTDLISFYTPFLEVYERKTSQASEDIGRTTTKHDWKYLLWAVFQYYEKSEDVVSLHIKMTNLRKLLVDAGLLKIVKAISVGNSSQQDSKDTTTNNDIIVPMPANRLELEIKKLLGIAHNGVPLPEGLPCQDRDELCTSTPQNLSFGMFQNIIFVVSVLCVNGACLPLDEQDAQSTAPVSASPGLRIVMHCLESLLPREMTLGGISPRVVSRYLNTDTHAPSPFSLDTVLVEHNQEASETSALDTSLVTPHRAVMGRWGKNITQTKQLYWYYSQLYPGGGSSSNTETIKRRCPSRCVLSSATSDPVHDDCAVWCPCSFLLSFQQCKEMLRDFDIFPTAIDYKVSVTVYF